jgi:hypothetical protein
MTELRPRGREHLAAARRERTPSSADRARLLRELLEAAHATDAALAPAPRRKLGSKLALLAALAGAIAGALYWLRHAA